MSKGKCGFARSSKLRWLFVVWLSLFFIGCGSPSSLHSAGQAQNVLQNEIQEEGQANPRGESEFELNLRKLINDYRRDKGLTPLDHDPHLQRLAKEHSKEMGRINTLSHEGFNDRFKNSGYNLAVENVAYNYATPKAQFEGWQSSPGHNSNMLHPDISHVGISKVGSYVTFFACGKKGESKPP